MTSTQTNDQKSLADRARNAASGAGERVSSAASSTVGAVKDHPYTAAGIVAGVAAAVGGAAFAATKRGANDSKGGSKSQKAH